MQGSDEQVAWLDHQPAESAKQFRYRGDGARDDESDIAGR